jgi:hypothetical protein
MVLKIYRRNSLYTVGVTLLAISILVVFGTDILVKKGKVKSVKPMLILKFSGLILTIVATIILILGER